MKMSGAEMLLESLKRENVQHIFGYPGGVVLPIFDALFKDPSLQVVLTRHEQGAVHAAEGYARSTNKVGVVLVTSGPGATNTVTGLADANMDSIPIVVITGQVPTKMIGNDAFQEADIVGISRSCTKHNFLVRKIQDLPRIIKEAFYIARTGRPGPVLVDLPKDVIVDRADFIYPDSVSIRSYNPTMQGNRWQIRKAAQAISKAKRPVLYAGGGIISSDATKELLDLVTLTNIPTTLTLMGLGALSGTHPRFMGMLGMHGTYAANMAIHHCDLLIAVGVRFDDRVTGKISEFSPHSKVIHIDIDPTSIRKNFHVDIPIVGDAKHILKDLIEEIKELNKPEPPSKEKLIDPWIEQVEEWEKEHPLTYEHDTEVIKPQYVIEKVYQFTQGDCIVSTDVGQHQMWTAQFFKFIKPNTWLTSGGLGTMGYGFPAAIGAQKAHPDKRVIAITGEGSFMMNIQELATVASLDIPVKIVILNNKYLGMVRQWQEFFYGGRYSSSFIGQSPDFVKLAEAFGIVGLKASRHDEVENIILDGFSRRGPVLMEFHVDPEENVFPMVPAGGSNIEMIFEAPEHRDDRKKRDSILTA
ncbi:biosynthetic-type acetolactate synthase large subunit [Leptospirillum ferrooxidans]|jgi:acetolactate synthase-1/2/3 large subunit|uniref:Acetolactate synthase n=2 Tax=root TaxID=1 RepID=I0ISA3_LEPFC|nr:biosynthetic-type acetolactate synthase large subunit [Leptospirillum ferrooxidans]MDA8149620.1 biosynthetic-type acetolactate synthase large subunit [Nitrospiraceae bacterium]BAM08152.1 acetolactate synthase, large subunit [Leptospirillum ferrooxidans C2-3]